MSTRTPVRRAAATVAQLIAAALITGTSLAQLAQAQSYSLDFEIVNRTNQPIVELWVSPISSSSWGRNFSNTFVADGGGRQKVTFYGNSSRVGCRHDIQVRFEAGATRHWNDIDLCRIRGFEIFVSNGSVRARSW